MSKKKKRRDFSPANKIPRKVLSPEQQHQVKQEILDTIRRLCAGDATICTFGHCKINKECAKNVYTLATVDYHERKLKGVLKNVKSKERRKLGRVHPDHRPDNQHEWIKLILGCYLWEHEWIAGNKKLEDLARSCKNVKEARHLLKWLSPVVIRPKGKKYKKKKTPIGMGA